MELPVLVVRTVALNDHRSLLEWTSPEQPAVFVRDGDGIVGIGERLRLQAGGADRVALLAEQWRAVTSRAVVDDHVNVPGTGLVAFGSIAFSASSPSPSVLIVPTMIVGRQGDVTWVTTIDTVELPEPTALGPAPTVTFAPPVGDEAAADDHYRRAVAAATAAIADGRVDKVVLARSLVGRMPTGTDRRGMLHNLARDYPQTSVFAVDGLLGASPETLVRVRAGSVSARVLAGTTARSRDAGADAAAASALVDSPKNRSEHELAVRSVLDALAPHVSAVERTPVPFALRLPNLWHLATDVHGDLVAGRSALDLVGALHPTAAVAGTPTAAALELIAELEATDRGRYAGPVGWVDAAGDGEWAIALRCAQLDDDGTVTAWAGAGIVAGSDPDRELEETNLKFRPVVDALT